MAKKVIFNQDVREALKKGADTVANAVRITLGPRGRNVALDKGFGGPTVTNDGVTIAKEISLTDKFEKRYIIIMEFLQKLSKGTIKAYLDSDFPDFGDKFTVNLHHLKLPEDPRFKHLLLSLRWLIQKDFLKNWNDIYYNNVMIRPSTGDLVVADIGMFEW